MNIKGFPPIGTRPTEKTLDSQEANATAENAKDVLTTPKDVFEKAKNNTIEQLVSKSKAQDLMGLKAKQLSTLKEKPLEPAGDCDPATRGIAKKTLEPRAICDPMARFELAGSCIPMKKLEPVADCEPGTRTLDKLKQQQLISIQKSLTKPEK